MGNQTASRRAITAGQQLAGVRRNVCSSPDARRRADHQRIDEIPALTSLWDRLNRRYKCDVRLCSDVIRQFQTRRWPGNVADLAAAVHEVFMVQGQSLGNTIQSAS